MRHTHAGPSLRHKPSTSPPHPPRQLGRQLSCRRQQPRRLLVLELQQAAMEALGSRAGAGRLQHAQQHATTQVAARRVAASRRRGVVVQCVYSHQPDHNHHHRRELEPRSALALAIDADCRGLTAAPRVQQPLPAPKRLRVAVDVDEVLGRFVYALNRFCKEAYGMDYGVSDYWVYEFAKIWKCSQDQSNHIVHEFFKSDHFNDGIPVIPEAFATLSRLSSSHELVVVTSRQHVIQDTTLEWLDRHYAGLFAEVYFGNHFALQGASRKKSDICKSIGADVLIDDNVGYALDCADAGIHVLLYDWEATYPWSKLPDGFSHPLIQVVHNWGEVEVALMALAAVKAAA